MQAMLDFGMPMGPIRLMDEVGLDVSAHVSEVLEAGLGKMRFKKVDGFRELTGTQQQASSVASDAIL